MVDLEACAQEIRNLYRDHSLPSNFGVDIRIRKPKDEYKIRYYEGEGDDRKKVQEIQVEEQLVIKVEYYADKTERKDKFKKGVLAYLKQENKGKAAGSKIKRKRNHWRHKIKGGKSERLTKLEEGQFEILVGPAPGTHNDTTSIFAQLFRASENMAKLGRNSQTYFDVSKDEIKVTDDDKVKHTFNL